MEWIGLVLGVIGTFSTLALLYQYWIRRVGARRLIGFDPKNGIDVICTTGAETKSKYGDSAAKRALAPEGELQGVAVIASALGRWYPGTELVLQMADRCTRKLDRDLILVGGSSGNKHSAAVLAWPSLHGLAQIDAPTSSLVAGRFECRGFDHQMKAGRPDQDLGLIVCSRNQWSPHSKSRLILFAGLTTYGTGAAADFFFASIAKSRRPFGKPLRHALRGRGITVIVVEAQFNNGYLSGCRLVHWESKDEASE